MGTAYPIPQLTGSISGSSLRPAGGVALQIKHAVYVAAMADRCDGDDAGTVIHEVDHPVVAGAHAQVGPVTGESSHAWRSGIDGQAVDNLGNSLAGGRVKLPKRAAGSRPRASCGYSAVISSALSRLATKPTTVATGCAFPPRRARHPSPGGRHRYARAPCARGGPCRRPRQAPCSTDPNCSGN